MFFVPILHATPQRPDNIIYKGNLYKLTQNSLLSPYLKSNEDKWKWLRKHDATNLWRGYFATFEIVDNKLVLKEIENASKKSILEKFLSVAETKDSFKLDYYTGTLILQGGKLLYSGRFFKIYEYHLFLEFENGILTKESRMNYMEYITYEKEHMNPLQEKLYKDEYPRALEKLEYYVAIENGGFLNELRMKYEKRFGEQISDFEFATENIYFSSEIAFPIGYNIMVTRTAKGALAKYYHYANDKVEVELSMEEWLDFVRALYKCRTNKWQKQYGEWAKGRKKWSFEVYFFGNDEPDKYSGFSTYPPNWNEFKKIIDDMETRIRRDSATRALETKLEDKHIIIYRVPITDFERFVKYVKFRTSELGRSYQFEVTRTATGAIAEYRLNGAYVEKSENLKAELSMEEWLSFIKAVYKCRINEWQEYYSSDLPNKTYFEWKTEIFFTDRDGLIFRGSLAYPPNWDEFKKALDGIEAKMRKNS